MNENEQVERLTALLDAQHGTILRAYRNPKATADALRQNAVMRQELRVLARKMAKMEQLIARLNGYEMTG